MKRERCWRRLPSYVAAKRALNPTPVAGMLEEVFNLDEGASHAHCPGNALSGPKRRSDVDAARRKLDRDGVPE
jgi:hypothetical protein